MRAFVLVILRKDLLRTVIDKDGVSCRCALRGQFVLTSTRPWCRRCSLCLTVSGAIVITSFCRCVNLHLSILVLINAFTCFPLCQERIREKEFRVLLANAASLTQRPCADNFVLFCRTKNRKEAMWLAPCPSLSAANPATGNLLQILAIGRKWTSLSEVGNNPWCWSKRCTLQQGNPPFVFSKSSSVSNQFGTKCDEWEL